MATPLTPKKWGLASAQVSLAMQGRRWVCRRAGCSVACILCGPKVVPTLAVNELPRDLLGVNSRRRNRSRSLAQISDPPQSDGATRGRWRCCARLRYGSVLASLSTAQVSEAFALGLRHDPHRVW